MSKLLIFIPIAILLSCTNVRLQSYWEIDFKKELLNNLELFIYYRQFNPLELSNKLSPYILNKQPYFDIKINVSNHILFENIELLNNINKINLNEKLINYKMDCYSRCDFITKRGLIFTFAIDQAENILWVNNEYYMIEDKSYNSFVEIIEMYMPRKTKFGMP